jgi:hypothetical protein
MKYIYNHPNIGIRAITPNQGKYVTGIYLDMNANNNRVVTHPNKNNINLF